MTIINRNPVELTIAEIIAGSLVFLPATLVLLAYVVDISGWLITPTGILGLLALGVTVVAFRIWQSHARFRVRLDGYGLIGFIVVITGLFTYILWLSRPSFLPITQSGDIVHHISLIDFIRQRQSLVHDPSLGKYLVEMTVYPPGSHILAALVTDWLGTTTVRVLHPLLALLVAIKAGIIYNLILRLIPPSRRNQSIAVAGVILLLLPYDYFLRSFTAWYFFAMVTAETFVVAMLWALVILDAELSSEVLAFFTLSGIAVLLTWPGWLPIPLASLTILLFIRRDISFTDRARWVSWATIPIFAIAVFYMLGRTGPTDGLITNEGSVVQPSIQIFGWQLLVLAMIGVAISIWSQRALPILLFSGALAAQTVVLWILAKNHMSSYYIVYKMFHLSLYPIVLFVAIALDTVWHFLWQMWPSAWKAHWQRSAVILPALVFMLILRRDLPVYQFSPFSEPLFEVGLWTKQHLPNGCVDYLVDNWVTAYWLHINMLGNPRVSQRTGAIANVTDFNARRDSQARWNNPGGLPYVIVGDLDTVPPGIRSNWRILYEAPPSAVAKRSDRSTCQNGHIPLDELITTPRRHTLARILSSLLP